MAKLNVIYDNASDLDVCKKCKGNCCKTFPGTIHPNQLGDIYNDSISLLKTGNYVIDFWGGKKYNSIYHLRPHLKNKREVNDNSECETTN